MSSVARSYLRAQREQLKPELFSLPTWAHPELIYWIDDYKKIRDALAGAKEVKAERERYLPKFAGMDAKEYEAYLQRATYFNFTGKTLRALVGSVFRRNPIFKNLPEALLPQLERITNQNESFKAFAESNFGELMSMGRFGLFADMPKAESTAPDAYLTGYIAENIMDWVEEENPDTGRMHYTRVVLRELVRGKDEAGKQQYFARYRVLSLTNGVYTQEVFENANGHAELEPAYSKGVITPKIKGQSLNEIPFIIVGKSGSKPNIKTPPILDIAELNISHYNSYADLEQGRYYTGFPIYQVENDGAQDVPEYEIGANRVWVTPRGCKASLLEFNGHGLKFLENALDIKEQQAAQLGGRMMGARFITASESDDSMKLKERNEQALLLEVATRSDEAFTWILRIWARMRGLTKAEADKIAVEFNKDFLFDGVGAREFRAIHSMYKDGVIPVEVVYHYLRKGDVIPDWMTLEEFKALIDNYEESFPGQPDAEARSAGYPDKKTELAEDRADEEAERAEREAAAARRSAETIARNQPAPTAPGGGPGGRPAPGRRPQ